MKPIELSDEAWKIVDTDNPSALTDVNVRAAMPGTPTMPRPATVITACAGSTASDFTGYAFNDCRDDTSVPGSGRIDERPHAHRDARAGNRNQRARMQHLGAVVRHFGGLAMMQLRDHARIGHQPRIRGHDAGHVFPQHHLRRAQRSRQQRRGEIGAAAAQRRHAAVRARGR